MQLFTDKTKGYMALLVLKAHTYLSFKDLGLFLFKKVKSTDFLLFRTPSAVIYNMKTAIIFVLINKMSLFYFSLWINCTFLFCRLYVMFMLWLYVIHNFVKNCNLIHLNYLFECIQIVLLVWKWKLTYLSRYKIILSTFR